MGFPWERIADYAAYYADWREGLRYLTAVTLLSGALALLWHRHRAALGWLPLYVVLLLGLFCQTLWVANSFPDDGDAAQYLLVAHSLAGDGDFDLKNNLASEDWRRFRWPMYHYGGTHLLEYNGRTFNWHEPGLPLLITPGYFLGGRLGVLLTLNLLWLLALHAARRLTEAIVTDPAALRFALAAVFLTSPLLLFAHLAFSEIAAAAVLALAARLEYAGDHRGARLFLLTLLLALLPLLNTRFGLISAGLVIFMLVDRRWPARAVIGTGAAGALLYFCCNRLLLGTFWPLVLLAHDHGQRFSPAIFAGGFFGLLLDREMGLFIYAPVYAVALFTWPRLFRHRRYALLLAATVLPYCLQSAAYLEWNANIAGGPRYLVAVLPLLAPLLALAWRQLATRPGRRGLLVGLLLLSFVIALGHVLLPMLCYGPLVGRGIPQPFVKLSELRGSTLYQLLPSFSPHRLVP